MTYRLAVLKNEWPEHHLEWIAAIGNSNEDIRYDVIDITRNDWLDRLLEKDYHLILARASDRTSYFKQLYDERLYIVNKVLNIPIYPSYEEILVYENKKFLSYWLKANKIPHPETWVFYQKDEALAFIENCSLPVVAKTAIGAAASGVKILNSRKECRDYLEKVFSDKGIQRRWGPNLRKGDYKKRIINRLKNIPELIRYFKRKFNATSMDPHRWFAIFQEYLPVEFEWRAVRIGDSFFAHKKIAQKGQKMFSGTSEVNWDGPSEKLLDFVEMVTDKRGFMSQAVDLFETEKGEFLVNELQCFFGSKNPHQMILEGKPGRYFKKDNKWLFEEGEFNTNNSYNLRLQHALSLLMPPAGRGSFEKPPLHPAKLLTGKR